jgi:hypothetical protein
MCQMEKTTVYLPEAMKQSLRRMAAASGRSEAELIREAIGTLVRVGDQPRPRARLFASGNPSLAEHVDEALVGFGER